MPSPSSPRQRWLLFAVIMLAFLPVIIDMTILHIAVPSLTRELAASSTAVLWIIDIYPLLMAGLLLPMGLLVDQYGVRRVLITGLSTFTLASIAAAFAPNAGLLIAARALLALGGAMILPCILAAVRKTFEDPSERALALGYWGAVSAGGAALGPLVGGALLEHFWWGSVFLINVPVMALVVPICARALPRDQGSGQKSWSIGQAVMMILGMIAMVYAIKAGVAGKVALWQAVAVFVLGLGLLGQFIRLQLQARAPMLDLSLFQRPAIVAGILMAVVSCAAFAGLQLTVAQELQFVLGRSPLEAGLFMVPLMIASGIGGPCAGFLNNLFGLRAVASCALLVAALALGALSRIGIDGGAIMVPALMALLGLALSIALTASSIAIMGSVSAEQAGAAGALEASGYELGAALGITFFGVLLSALFSQAIVLPEGLSVSQIAQASASIGDALTLAPTLPEAQASALITAAKAAFSSTHASVLGISAIAIALLAVSIALLLSDYKASDQAHG